MRLKKLSDFYGITHAIGCPSHGLAGVLLKLGIFLPASLTALLTTPHRLVEDYIVKPPVEYLLRERYEDYEERAEEIAHHATDIIGWTAFGGFIAYGASKYYKKRRENKI